MDIGLYEVVSKVTIRREPRILPSNFVGYLDGKKVCDLGSGYDRFALEVVLGLPNTTVISINPNRSSADFNDWRWKIIEDWHSFALVEYTLDQIRLALVQVDQRAIPAYAHDLSGITDEAFDDVFDVRAVFHYSLPEYRQIYLRSLREMLRVTKPGGRIWIADTVHIGEEITPWYQELFDGLGLDYQYIQTKIQPWEEGITTLGRRGFKRTGLKALSNLNPDC